MKGEDHAADCNVESLELDLFEFLQWFVFFKKKTNNSSKNTLFQSDI